MSHTLAALFTPDELAFMEANPDVSLMEHEDHLTGITWHPSRLHDEAVALYQRDPGPFRRGYPNAHLGCVDMGDGWHTSCYQSAIPTGAQRKAAGVNPIPVDNRRHRGH